MWCEVWTPVNTTVKRTVLMLGSKSLIKVGVRAIVIPQREVEKCSTGSQDLCPEGPQMRGDNVNGNGQI